MLAPDWQKTITAIAHLAHRPPFLFAVKNSIQKTQKIQSQVASAPDAVDGSSPGVAM